MKNIIPFQTPVVDAGIGPEEAIQRLMRMGEPLFMSVSLCPPGSINVGQKVMMYDGTTMALVVRKVPSKEARDWMLRVFPDQPYMLNDPGPFVEVIPD